MRPPPLYFAGACITACSLLYDAIAKRTVCVGRQEDSVPEDISSVDQSLLSTDCHGDDVTRCLLDSASEFHQSTIHEEDDDGDDGVPSPALDHRGSLIGTYRAFDPDDRRGMSRMDGDNVASSSTFTPAGPSLRTALMLPDVRPGLQSGSLQDVDVHNCNVYRARTLYAPTTLIVYGGVVPRDGCSVCVYCVAVYGATGVFPSCECCVPYDGVHALDLRTMRWICISRPKRSFVGQVLRWLSLSIPSMRSLSRLYPRGPDTRSGVPARRAYEDSLTHAPLARVCCLLTPSGDYVQDEKGYVAKGRPPVLPSDDHAFERASRRLIMYGGVGWRDVASDVEERALQSDTPVVASRRWALFDDIWTLDLQTGVWERKWFVGAGPATTGHRVGVSAPSHVIAGCVRGDADQDTHVYRIGSCAYILHSLPMTVGGFNLCLSQQHCGREQPSPDARVTLGSEADVRLEERVTDAQRRRGQSRGRRAGVLAGDRVPHLGGGVALWRLDLRTLAWTVVNVASSVEQPFVADKSEQEEEEHDTNERALFVGAPQVMLDSRHSPAVSSDGHVRPRLLACPPCGGMTFSLLPSGEPLLSVIGGWLDLDVVPSVIAAVFSALVSHSAVDGGYDPFSRCRVCSGDIMMPLAGMTVLRALHLLGCGFSYVMSPESRESAAETLLMRAASSEASGTRARGGVGAATGPEEVQGIGASDGDESESVEVGAVVVDMRTRQDQVIPEHWGTRIPRISCFDTRQDTSDGVPIALEYPALFSIITDRAVDGFFIVMAGGIDRSCLDMSASEEDVTRRKNHISRVISFLAGESSSPLDNVPPWWSSSRLGTLSVGGSFILNALPVHCFARHLLWRYSFVQRPLTGGDDLLFLRNARKLYLKEHVIDQMLDDVELPDFVLCPIGMGVMSQPVITSDGYTYERGDIHRWFAAKHTSPSTNEQVDDFALHRSVLVPNMAVRRAIRTMSLEQSEGECKVSVIPQGLGHAIVHDVENSSAENLANPVEASI